MNLRFEPKSFLMCVIFEIYTDSKNSFGKVNFTIFRKENAVFGEDDKNIFDIFSTQRLK